MEKLLFSVPKISCGHCVAAIQNELNELDGVSQVDGDPQTKTVNVTWQAPASEAQIKEKLKAIGYPAT